jgi:hypothetical protein
VQDPSDGVVDGLGLGKGLMTAFMGNDPKTSGDQASGEPVHSPESDARSGIEIGRREAQVFGRDERVDICHTLVEASEEKEVPDAGAQISTDFGVARRQELTYKGKT